MRSSQHITFTNHAPERHTRQLELQDGQVIFFGQVGESDDTLQLVAQKALEGDGQAFDPSCLSGTFTTVALRDQEARIWADPSNQFPVVWRLGEKGVELGTRADMLDDEVDPVTVAAKTILPGAPELVDGRTVFRDVHQTEGGQVVHLIADGTVSRKEYLLPDIQMTLEEAAEKLRATLLEEIACIANNGQLTTSDISGGIDSTSAGLLLARRIGGMEGFFQWNPDIPAGDIESVKDILRDEPTIRLHMLSTNPEILPFSDLNKVENHSEPDPAATINARIRHRLTAAQSYGSQLHMTGDGGDAVLDAPPHYLVDLARMGDQDRFNHDSLTIAWLRYYHLQNFRSSLQARVDTTVVDNLMAISLHLQGLREKGSRGLGWTNGSDEAQLLTPGMRQKVAQLAEQRAAETTVPPEMGVADYVLLKGLRDSGLIHRHLREIALGMGIDTVAPFMANAVVKTCLEVPAYKKAHPYKFKQIIGEAFKGILPDNLLQRTSKGNYGGEEYQGLRRNFPVVKRLLASSCLVEMGIVEPNNLARELDKLWRGRQGAFPAINRMVAAELWLRQKGFSPTKKPAKRASARHGTKKQGDISPSSNKQRGQLYIPPHVHSLLHESGVVYLDSLKGEYSDLGPLGSLLLQTISEQGNGGDLYSHFQALFPDSDTAAMRQMIDREIEQLCANGVVVRGNKRSQPLNRAERFDRKKLEKAGEVPMVSNASTLEHLVLNPAEEEAALDGLHQALKAKDMPFPEMVQEIKKAREHAKQMATEAQVKSAMWAVRKVGWEYKGRLACLESTTATLFTLAELGLQATMQLCVAFDPKRFHAYPLAKGTPVRTELDEQIEGVYYPLFSI